MLKWTWSPAQNSQLVSAPSCGTATTFSSGAEEYDMLYTPVNCKVVNFLCSWQKWSIGLTPYKCLTFSLLPLLSSLPAPETPQTTTSIKSHTLLCTKLHRTARMFALYFSITDSLALHSSDSVLFLITSLFLLLLLEELLLFYFSLHLRWKRKCNGI